MSWNQYIVSRRCQLIIDGASLQKVALRNLHMIVFLLFSREVTCHDATRTEEASEAVGGSEVLDVG